MDKHKLLDLMLKAYNVFVSMNLLELSSGSPP